MSYTAPTINATGQTWAQLQQRGLEGFVKAALVANSATQPNTNQSMRVIHKTQLTYLHSRLVNVIDNYIAGKSDKTSAKADLLEINYAIKNLNTCVEEIGVLIDAN